MSLGLTKLAAAGITSICLLFNSAGTATFSDHSENLTHTGKDSSRISQIFEDARKSVQVSTRNTSTQKALERYKSAINENSACLGYATDKLLDYADDKNLPEPAIAEKIVSDLSSREIRQLPMKTKINLIKALTSDGKPDGKIQRALIKVYQNTGEDPAFALWDAVKQEQLANVLKDDKKVIEARKKWRSLDEDERVEILQYISDLTVKVYGSEFKMSEARVKAKDLGRNTYGQYKSWFDLIEINLDHPDLDRSFEQSVSTTLHETMHAFHDHIDNLANRNKIKNDHPTYLMAKLMVKSYSHRGYITSSDSFAGYLSNPTERHANEVGFIARYAGRGPNYKVPDYIRESGEDFKKDFDKSRNRALNNAKTYNLTCPPQFSP
jgi:hypothetical protein